MYDNAVFWIIIGIGATLAAIAMAYRLGHTVGYSQAASLTLPRFETVELGSDASSVETAELESEEVVLST